MTTRLGILLCVLCLQSALAAGNPDASDFQSAVRSMLPQGAAVEDDRVAGQEIHGKALIARMYRSNAFRPLWSPAATAALSTELDGLIADGLEPWDYRFPRIADLLAAPGEAVSPPARVAELDILLAEAFLRALYNLYFGKVDPERLDSNINFLRPLDGDDPAPELTSMIREERIPEAFDQMRLQHPRHLRLKEGLARYRGYPAAAGWAPIPGGKTLKPGESDPRVPLLRQRLAIIGDLTLGILIAYDTARTENGQVYFRPDIYKRDSAVLAALDGEFRIRRMDIARGD